MTIKVLKNQLVTVPTILEGNIVSISSVRTISFAIIMQRVMVRLVNVAKRTEWQNTMVIIVICLSHAMGIHVRMVGNVSPTLKRTLLRPVSSSFIL